MKIVVLDGYTLNPGDLSWDELNALGEVVIYNRTPVEKVVERSKDAEILMTNKVPLTNEMLAELPKLKYVGILATGYNVVDTLAASERGILVANVPTYGTESVAQMTFALLLELCHHVQDHSNAVKSGAWSECIDFCFWNSPLVELLGKTMGIIGFGKIGQKVATIAKAFGMNIIAYDKYKNDNSNSKDFKWSDIDELFREADVVSLHCPLFPETKGIVNKERLHKMKKTAFLINTSRGPLVVDKDLAEALNNGLIAGAGLDVLTEEPPSSDSALLNAKNCIITPHISWATKEARSRLMNTAIFSLKAFLSGNPINLVNK